MAININLPKRLVAGLTQPLGIKIPEVTKNRIVEAVTTDKDGAGILANILPDMDLAVSLDPVARLNALATVVTSILPNTLKTAPDVANMLVGPMAIFSDMSVLEGVLDRPVLELIRERKLLEYLINLSSAQLDLMMNEVVRIRDMVPGVDGPVYSLGKEMTPEEEAFLNKGLSNVIIGKTKIFSYANKVIPRAFAQLIMFEDLYEAVLSVFTTTLNRPISRSECFNLFAMFSAGSDFESKEGKFMGMDTFLSRQNVDSALPCAHCNAKPMVDIAKDLTDLVIDTKAFLVNMMINVPAMGIDFAVGLVMTGKEVFTGVMNIKIAVLQLLTMLTAESVEMILAVPAFALLAGLDVNNPQDIKAAIPQIPMDTTLYPGGITMLSSIVANMKHYYILYAQALQTIGVEHENLRLEDFCGIMGRLVLDNSAEMCLDGKCADKSDLLSP